jgi:predicted nucleic acid-binding protein
MVLIDTPVWLLALRRRVVDLSGSEQLLTQVLHDVIQQRRALLLGSVRQEILSGIREESQFRRIRDYLRAFPNVGLDSVDYEEAARISSDCRRTGIATSAIDMLICAVCLRNDWDVFTTDRDFERYHHVARIRLLKV